MNTNILAQEMAYAASQIPQEITDKQIVIWKERRDVMVQGLIDLGLELWKPEGAFYVLPKIKNPSQAINDLYYQHKVIAYDGTWFGAPDRVRFSYALDVEKIREGLTRLGRYLKERKV
jgi:aspartate/methionine/tyrosine aminotransferase